ncbi:hypothetical protein GCM10009619_42660 [Williamsia maris]
MPLVDLTASEFICLLRDAEGRGDDRAGHSGRGSGEVCEPVDAGPSDTALGNSETAFAGDVAPVVAREIPELLARAALFRLKR